MVSDWYRALIDILSVLIFFGINGPFFYVVFFKNKDPWWLIVGFLISMTVHYKNDFSQITNNCVIYNKKTFIIKENGENGGLKM